MASPQPPLQRLLRSLRPHRRLVWLAASCSVLNKLFDLAPPVLIGLAVGCGGAAEHLLAGGAGGEFSARPAGGCWQRSPL